MKNKKNKLIVVVICIILLITSITFVFMNKNDNEIKSSNKNAIGVTDITKKTYGYPCISLVIYSLNRIEVNAGIYRYGDVTQDGVIDGEDSKAIERMIDYSNAFTADQIKLGDIDENGKITKNDVDMFNKYLKKNKEVKYDINLNKLKYCMTKTNNSSNCEWKDSKEFDIPEKSNYYIFVKNKTNNIVSSSAFFDKTVMEQPLEK